MKRTGHGHDRRHPKHKFFALGSCRLKNQVLGTAYFPYVFPFKNGSYGKVCLKISKRQENQQNSPFGYFWLPGEVPLKRKGAGCHTKEMWIPARPWTDSLQEPTAPRSFPTVAFKAAPGSYPNPIRICL